MATRTRARRTETAPGSSPEDSAEEIISPGVRNQREDDAEDELIDLGVQLPEGAMGTIWRLLDGGEKEFVDEQPVAGFTIAGVAARFGGGRYIMYLKRPHPDYPGRWFKAGSHTFRITGAPKVVPVDVAPIAAGAPGETPEGLKAVAELINSQVKSSLENQEMMSRMHLALLTNLTRPAESNGLTETLLKLLLDGRNNQQQLTVSDVITLSEKMANKGSPIAQLRESVEMLGLVKQLGGGDSDQPAWMGIAEKAIGVFSRAVPYTPDPRQIEAAEQIEDDTRAPASPAASPAGDSIVPASSHPLLKWLGPQIPGLIEKAQRDLDPDNYGGALVDMLPAMYYDDVIAFLQSPDFLQQLRAAFPMTDKLASWFSELADNVVDRIKEIQKPDTADAQQVTE